MASHRRIELSGREITHLNSTNFLPPELAQVIQMSQAIDGDKRVLNLSPDPDVAERFREEFTNRLAKVGFGPDYEPTSEGRMLEGLIDRFYRGS